MVVVVGHQPGEAAVLVAMLMAVLTAVLLLVAMLAVGSVRGAVRCVVRSGGRAGFNGGRWGGEALRRGDSGGVRECIYRCGGEETKETTGGRETAAVDD